MSTHTYTVETMFKCISIVESEERTYWEESKYVLSTTKSPYTDKGWGRLIRNREYIYVHG